MREALALNAYGLLLLSGAFMTFFWGRLGYRRVMQQKNWYHALTDTYSVLSTCLCLSSVGTSLFFSARAYGFIVDGLSTVSGSGILSVLILMGLYVLAVAKAGFVWAVHMDHRSRVWRAYVILSFLWIVLVNAWVAFDPLNTYPYGGQHGGFNAEG